MRLTNTQQVNVIIRTALSMPAVEPSIPNSLSAQVMEWQLCERFPPVMPTLGRKSELLRTIAVCMAISCWPETTFLAEDRAALVLRHLNAAIADVGKSLFSGTAREELIAQLLPLVVPPANTTDRQFGLGELGSAALLLIDLACEPQWFGVNWQRRQNPDFSRKARRLAGSLELATTNGGRVNHLAGMLRELNWTLKQAEVPATKSAQIQTFVRVAMWPLITGKELPHR